MASPSSASVLQPLGFVLAVGAVVVAAAVLLPQLLGAAGGAESEILDSLQRAQSRGFSIPVEGAEAPLISGELRWARITIAPSTGDLTRAEAIATLDFEGSLGATKVSSLGLERIPFVLRDGEWIPEQGHAPVLARIVSALERRRRAIERADRAALAALSLREADAASPELDAAFALAKRRFTVSHWYVRSERDEVLVTEKFKLEGELPDRPVTELGDRRLTLQPRAREFVFDSSLM